MMLSSLWLEELKSITCNHALILSGRTGWTCMIASKRKSKLQQFSVRWALLTNISNVYHIGFWWQCPPYDLWSIYMKT
ncbi:MAG: hypothetical protein ACRDEA_15625, partial [Microcystaceae cyanobacterium]